jgi:hypothetical protein
MTRMDDDTLLCHSKGPISISTYIVYNFEKVQITLSNIQSSSDISFGYVTGPINNSFNAIRVFKTTVTRSQRNGKDNANMKYCRWVAG